MLTYADVCLHTLTYAALIQVEQQAANYRREVVYIYVAAVACSVAAVACSVATVVCSVAATSARVKH